MPGGDLTQVRALAVSDQGYLFVLQHRFHEVRVFDALTGALSHLIGGEGQGPGEFMGPSSLGLRGDTLWVAEAGRIQYFEQDGRVLRTEIIGPAPPGFGSGSAVPLAGDWRLMNPVRIVTSPVESPPDDDVRVLYRQGAEDGVAIRISGLRQDRLLNLGAVSGRPVLAYAPGTGYQASAVEPDGSSVLLMDQSEIVDRRGRAVSLVRITPYGDTIAASRIATGAGNLPPSVLDHSIRRQADLVAPAFGSFERAEKRIRGAISDGPVPAPLSGMVASVTGEVWLAPQRSSGAPWVVLERGLEPLGWVRFPDDMNVVFADAQSVWATQIDASGWHHVVKFAIER